MMFIIMLTLIFSLRGIMGKSYSFIYSLLSYTVAIKTENVKYYFIMFTM